MTQTERLRAERFNEEDQQRDTEERMVKNVLKDRRGIEKEEIGILNRW